jgi:tetratricopeptide (TPR) repeat protein
VLADVRARWPRSRAIRIALAAGLLAVIGLCAYRVGRSLWANRELTLAQAALDVGQVATAREHLLFCLRERPDDPEVHLLLARAARREGKFQEADEQLLSAKRLGAVLERLQLEHLLQHVQRGQGGAAEGQLWAYCEKGHPDHTDILEALARGYLATFRLDQARTALDRLLEMQPRHATAWLLRGKASYHMRGYAEAAHDYGQAVQLAPEDGEARQLLAECLLDNAQPTAARPHFEQLRAQGRGDTEVLVGYVRCLIDLGRLEEAQEPLDELLRSAPDNATALALRGKLHLKKFEPALAEPWLRKAIQLEPGNREAVYNLSLCLQQQPAQEKKTEAARWLKQYGIIDSEQANMKQQIKEIMARPHDPAPRARAGKIFLKIGNEKEGLRWLYSALQLDPRHTESHSALRDYYRGKGQADRAAVHERALEKS